jgi:hypothetical protein
MPLIGKLIAIAVLFAAGYLRARWFRNRYGRSPWGWSPLTWGIVWMCSLLVGALLLMVAERSGRARISVLDPSADRN